MVIVPLLPDMNSVSPVLSTGSSEMESGSASGSVWLLFAPEFSKTGQEAAGNLTAVLSGSGPYKIVL